MQTINTQEWTEVTGLTQGTTYVVQASKKGYFSTNPIQVFWTQNEPAEENSGLLAEAIKIKYSGKLFVKSEAIPIFVNFEVVN